MDIVSISVKNETFTAFSTPIIKFNKKKLVFIRGYYKMGVL